MFIPAFIVKLVLNLVYQIFKQDSFMLKGE